MKKEQKYELTINQQNLDDLCVKLVNAYKNRTHVFTYNHTPPEVELSKMFPVGELEHAMHNFMSISLDTMRPSAYIYRGIKNVLSEVSVAELFKMEKDKITYLMEKYVDNGLNSPADIIYNNLEILRIKYGSDPRNIFSGNISYTFNEARKILVNNFQNVGNFVGTLMLKNFLRFEYAKISNMDEIPPKIDRHGIRMSIGNQAIYPRESGRYHKSNIDRRLEAMFIESVKNTQVDPFMLDDAKWMLGSKVCNLRSYKACSELCPLKCNMLVRLEESGTYIVYPSDTRNQIDCKETKNRIGEKKKYKGKIHPDQFQLLEKNESYIQKQANQSQQKSLEKIKTYDHKVHPEHHQYPLL